MLEKDVGLGTCIFCPKRDMKTVTSMFCQKTLLEVLTMDRVSPSMLVWQRGLGLVTCAPMFLKEKQ